jgi:hypothetical protein
MRNWTRRVCRWAERTASDLEKNQSLPACSLTLSTSSLRSSPPPPVHWRALSTGKPLQSGQVPSACGKRIPPAVFDLPSSKPPSRVAATQDPPSVVAEGEPSTPLRLRFGFQSLSWAVNLAISSRLTRRTYSGDVPTMILGVRRVSEQCSYVQVVHFYVLKIDPLGAIIPCLLNCSDPGAVEPSR